jgi:hypothetical protein
MTDRLRGAGTRRGVASVVAGLLTFAVVGAAWLDARGAPAPTWTATTSLVVMPADDIDRWAAASAAEALGTGQVAATAAEVLRSRRVAADAAWEQGFLDGRPAPEVTVSVAVVPGTAVLRVTASAPARAVAEATAEALPRAGAAYLRTVAWPYRLVTVAPAGAARVPQRRPTVTPAALAVAALAALAVQQAWYRFPARRGPRRSATAEEASG